MLQRIVQRRHLWAAGMFAEWLGVYGRWTMLQRPMQQWDVWAFDVFAHGSSVRKRFPMLFAKVLERRLHRTVLA